MSRDKAAKKAALEKENDDFVKEVRAKAAADRARGVAR